MVNLKLITFKFIKYLYNLHFYNSSQGSSLAYEPVLLSILTCISDCCAPSRFCATEEFTQASSLYSLVVGKASTKKSVCIARVEKCLNKAEDELNKLDQEGKHIHNNNSKL